jgi:hypothetical protein
MFGLDTGTLLLWLVLGVVVVLSGAITDWERFSSRQSDLPLWRFLARRGVGPAGLAAKIGASAVEAAEMRCTLCGLQERCAQRLRAGARSPLPDCPNASLFTARAA